MVTRFAAVALGCLIASSAWGQNIGELFGGLIAAAQTQAAQEAWARQPDYRRYCMERALSRRGAGVSRLIQGGVGPDDARLQALRNECAPFEPSALRTNFRCSVNEDAGSTVPSLCDQRYGRPDNYGRVQYLDLNSAMESHFAGNNPTIYNVETEIGRQERADRAAGAVRLAELARLRSAVEPFRTSRSDLVRGQSQNLLQRMSAGSPTPSESALDNLRTDQQRLAQLEQQDLARLEAIEKLSSLKARVQKKVDGAPVELKEELTRLNGQYAEALRPPALPSSPATRSRKITTVSPTFDCGKAKAAIEVVVCSDPAASRLDVEMFQPYYVLRHLRPELREELKREAIQNTRRVLDECRLPGTGSIPASAIKPAASCVVRLYRQQRDAWRVRVETETNGVGRDEANRPAPEHLQLEQALQTAGYLPSDAQLDGVFGIRTRAAITSFQTAAGLQADGLMTSATASRLSERGDAGPSVVLDPGREAAVTQTVVALHARFTALEARIDEVSVQRTRQEQLAAKVEDGRKAAEAAVLAQPLPDGIKDRVGAFIKSSHDASTSRDSATLGRLAQEFDALKPQLDDAVAVAKATTGKNGFLLQGEPDEVLVLYNDSGRAPSVVKNLRGELVFEAGRTVSCQPNAGNLAQPVARELNARLTKWSQSIAQPMSSRKQAMKGI